MKNKELFIKRLKITIVLLVIYFVMANITIPFIQLEVDNGTILTLIASINGASGNGLKLFSLGLMPYFMSTLVLKLLSQGLSESLTELRSGTQEQRKLFLKISNWIFYVIAIIQSFSFLYIKLNNEEAITQILTKEGLATVFVLFLGALVSKWLAEQITKKGLANGYVLVIALMLLSETLFNVWNMYLSADSIIHFIICLSVIMSLYILGMVVQNYSFKIPATIDISANLGECTQKYVEDKFRINLMCVGITPIVYLSFISPLFSLIGIKNEGVLTLVSFVLIYGLTNLSVKADYKPVKIIDTFMAKGVSLQFEQKGYEAMVKNLKKVFERIIILNTTILFGYYASSIAFSMLAPLQLLSDFNVNGIQILMLSYVTLEIVLTINAYFIKEAPELIY